MQMSAANAAEAPRDPNQTQGDQQSRHEFMDKITRTVEKTETGAVITLTTTDPDALAMLQKGPDQQRPDPEGVTKTVEQLSDGIKITLVGADADAIQKIQDHASEDPQERHHGHGDKNGMHQEWMKNVKESVENTDSGVTITLSSDDPDLVAKIQEFAKKQAEHHAQEAQQNTVAPDQETSGQ